MASPLPGVKGAAKKTTGLIDTLGNGLISGGETNRYQNLTDYLGNLGKAQTKLATGPLAQQGMQGAQTGANYAAGTAGSGYDFSQSLVPYASSVLDMGFDPQQELYNRTLHQTQEQQRVGQAARGIEMSPYGAGLENDALKNFNIDWQNSQLDRAIAAGNAGSALGQTAFGLGSDASKLAASGSLLPYSTKLGFLNDKGQGLNTQLGALEREADFGTRKNQTTQQQISDLLQYLGMGPGYQGAATGQQNADTNTISTGLGLVSGLMGKGG